MRAFLLISLALLLPLAWGWGVYRVLAWLWPVRPNGSRAAKRDAGGRDSVIDYQI